MNDKIAYTVQEATAALGIGRTTLYALIKDRQLPVVKVGHRTLIRRVDLDDLLDSCLVRH
jgi:excisionase family DNA binding protein